MSFLPFAISTEIGSFFAAFSTTLTLEGPRHIGVGHLTAVDTRIHELSVLMPGEFAERQSMDSEWEIGKLDPE